MAVRYAALRARHCNSLGTWRDVTLGNDHNGTDGQTDGQTDRQSATPREEGRIITFKSIGVKLISIVIRLSTVCTF